MTRVSPDSPLRFLATLGVKVCALDLEATGKYPTRDRIVSWAIATVDPQAGDDVWADAGLINPEQPIPSSATATHGLTDADVAAAPTWADAGSVVARALHEAVVVGHGVTRFDIPLVQAEQRRCGKRVPEPSGVIDTLGLMTRFEPRRLEAAVAFYLGRPLTGAHSSEGDVLDAVDVLQAQVRRYLPLLRDDETGATLAERLQRASAPDPDPDAADRAGKFVWQDQDLLVNFGPHAGAVALDVNPKFYRWMLSKDFPEDAKAIARGLLAGQLPLRSVGA